MDVVLLYLMFVLMATILMKVWMEVIMEICIMVKRVEEGEDLLKIMKDNSMGKMKEDRMGKMKHTMENMQDIMEKLVVVLSQ